MKSIGARLVAVMSSLGKKKRPAKYGNTRVASADGAFDSKAEYARWLELNLLLKAGEIADLQRQVRYPLTAHDQLIGHYVADFVYQLNGEEVIEDVKGHRTQLFIWKARHFRAQYGKDITIVK